MNNDNSATYGMVALALAVFLSLVALFAAPWLARWLAESATAGYGYAYAYDYPGTEARPRYWPLGSTQLLLASLKAVSSARRFSSCT